MVTLTKIISARMANNSPTEHTLRPNQLDQLVCNRALRIALTVSLDVAQVADMALVVVGSTVGLLVGVDCSGKVSTSLPSGVGGVD